MEDWGTNSKSGKLKAENGSFSEIVYHKSAIVNLLVGFVGLLAFSAWWHLDVANNFYPPGVRWTGLYDNPNIYGMLMGAGVVLAIGLRAAKRKAESGKRKIEIIFLWIVAGMMLVGLIMSYSRGAWVATAAGLLYLAWNYGKLKWRYVVIGAGLLALGAGLVWGRTADSAPWFVKRADLGRPSAQHRVAAWKAGLQMMWDHPLGVGWNRAVNVYDKNYSPPEGGAAALTMNSYLMLGTELGVPGLVCFVAYVGLSFRNGRARHSVRAAIDASGGQRTALPTIQIACRAGALVFVVAFWFDGGLFTLATASVFWVLLELGNSKAEMLKPL
jgi:O-antigen ligase